VRHATETEAAVAVSVDRHAIGQMLLATLTGLAASRLE
jgi:hypothetical protein